MEVIGYIILTIGAVLLIFGKIGFIIATFRESIWWGLGSLFIPFVGLFFLISHWEDAKGPFFLALMGVGILFVGLFLSGNMNSTSSSSSYQGWNSGRPAPIVAFYQPVGR